MNKKLIILLSALAGAALCVGIGYVVANVPPAADDGQSNSNNSTVPADRVDVVYFHRTVRCSTCLRAEELTRYTLNTYFADELASKKVVFQSVDVEDPANADIVAKYNNASYLTLCINTVTNGTENIEEVTDIWYVGDEEFVDILKNEVEESLAGEV
jgi:hypothetical protein